MSSRLPRGVVALGFVSLFMDMSSEMIHALLPIYLTTTLGASALMVGLIEGLGQATAQLAKFASGFLSDRTGQRKPLTLVGYGLGALTKPVFALATGPAWILFARLADRLGKGIRGTPRDAMVADMVPPAQRAAAYGLRQSMDSFGAFAGPILAVILMSGFAVTIPQIFMLAVVPAILSVLVLAIAVKEPARVAPAKGAAPVTLRDAGRLGPPFWRAIILASIMTIARISDAFLILRASEAGLALAMTPLVLVVINLVDSAASWPVGVLADRIGKRGLLIAGFALLIPANLLFGFGHGLIPIFAGLALWGLHMGLTQGLLSAMIADTAPPDLRGTAFGLFNLATGIAVLVGSVGAGAIWAGYGSATVFAVGAGVALLATLAASARNWPGRVSAIP